MESWRFTTTLTKLWRVMVPGHRSENHSSSSSGWFWQRWTNTQRAGMEDGRGVYQKHKTRQVQAHTQTNRANCGRGQGTAPRILPSFSSVWWILEGFLRPDRHLPSRLKKFSSSSRPYSIALPSDSFTALVNLTWDVQERLGSRTWCPITLVQSKTDFLPWRVSYLFPRKKLGEAEKLYH